MDWIDTMKFRTATLLLLAVVAVPAAASEPEVSFGASGVTLEQLQPATQVVWMSLTRQNAGYHSDLHVQRGIGLATSGGALEIARAGADESRSIWLLAELNDDGLALDFTSPGYSKSISSINVVSGVGARTFTVESRQAEIVYVRRQVGAWSISTMDGGLGDQDEQQNATIVVPLLSMEPFDGSPTAPTTLAAGDFILIIDPYSNRTAVVTVSP